MTAYWLSNAANYVIGLVALAVAVRANSKINDHYEHDHINNENEYE